MTDMSTNTVAARLREAWDTLRRVPAASVPGYRTGWPDVVQDYLDAYGYTAPSVKLTPAAPAAIDRMHEVFGWFAFLADAPHLTRAVWLTCGCGMGPRRAGQVLGIHRNTVRARRQEALRLIVEGLKKPPVAKVQFVRQSAQIPR